MSDDTNKEVETTGHIWDDDLSELNNPLPRWWVWTFYATILFSIIYWLIYPTWPYANTYTTGVMNDITYKVGDKEVTTHWNTRAKLVKEMQEGEISVKHRNYNDRVTAASYQQIFNDPDMLAFSNANARVLFAENCAGCHGPGAALPETAMGLYPNLSDDVWLWGGKVEEIEASIKEGRMGFMPAYAEALSAEQIDQVANYVLSLSEEGADTAKVEAGKEIFHGHAGGCNYCHGDDAKGLSSQGAANLTDKIWTVANLEASADVPAKLEVIKKLIASGVAREMPPWSERLQASEIKQLAIYVHQIGGGK